MNTGRTIFSQLMDFLPTHEFRSCVERYNGNYKMALPGYSYSQPEISLCNSCLNAL